MPINYLAIYVNTENDENFKNIQSSNLTAGSDGAFAIAKIAGTNSESYQLVNFTNRGHYIRYFNPPIQFSKVKVSFRQADGNLYNFYGLDNFLLFEIKQMFAREIITNTSWSN